MTIQEARFILSAYRPSGADAALPAFSDALRMAAADPSLGAWFARSRAHDAAVAGKLRQVEPPSGLREAILAGVRVSDSQRSRGPGRTWIAGLAAAAALAIVVISMKAPTRPASGAAALAEFAINDMANGRHGGRGEPAGALIAELETRGARMPSAEQIDFEKLRDTGCRALNFAGHDVLEVCFSRDGAVFHFYVARRGAPAGGAPGGGPSFVAEAAGAAAAWSDSRFDYAVASTAGLEAIRKLL
ncbi:MAG TPA: hypothetical protein VN775_11265 [Opitutaceae bacterium]|nr:hypothetical protein [Opitutaceae bacterium]